MTKPCKSARQTLKRPKATRDFAFLLSSHVAKYSKLLLLKVTENTTKVDKSENLKKQKRVAREFRCSEISNRIQMSNVKVKLNPSGPKTFQEKPI